MLPRFIFSSLLLLLTALPLQASELFFNQQKCVNEANPEGIFLWDQFYFCQDGNGPKKTELVYFLGDGCPRAFTRQTDFDLTIDTETMSACSPSDTNWFTNYSTHPKRVSFHKATCPSGKVEFAGTDTVKFCR